MLRKLLAYSRAKPFLRGRFRSRVARTAVPILTGCLSLTFAASTLMAAGNPTPNPNCVPNVVPTGQATPPGAEAEPMAPIWCFTLTPQGPPTRVSGANDWVDTFQGV